MTKYISVLSARQHAGVPFVGAAIDMVYRRVMGQGTTSARKSPQVAAPRPVTADSARPGRARPTLEREHWLAAARTMLIRDGIAAVKVDRLAKALKVTRGGFYWRFTGHKDLLESLLADWRDNNSATTLEVLRGPGTPVERFRALMDVWIDERGFDPAYDVAVREWARVSKSAAKVIAAVDDERIEAFHQLFLDAGYPGDEAFIRARIVYYHQVGYYAMGVSEARDRRHDLADLYFRALTGFG
jgi:AcrR family transcriptional regulator